VRNLFGEKPSHDPAVIDRLKSWAREMLALDETVRVMVTELRCGETDCPDVETVIALLDVPGQARKLKVSKPLAEVTRDDLLVALKQQPTEQEQAP
jgi:hypothetical protein